MQQLCLRDSLFTLFMLLFVISSPAQAPEDPQDPRHWRMFQYTSGTTGTAPHEFSWFLYWLMQRPRVRERSEQCWYMSADHVDEDSTTS